MYNINLSNKYWIHLRPTLTVYKADSYGTGWLHYTAEGPASPCPGSDISVLIITYHQVWIKTWAEHFIGNLRAESRVHTFPKAGPGQHLSSQQRHYHHNLSEGGAKTVINVVIINDIHLSYPSHNCIKYLREKVVLRSLIWQDEVFTAPTVWISMYGSENALEDSLKIVWR